MTAFRTRRVVKALVFMMVLTACQSNSHPLYSTHDAIQVTLISKAMPDPESSDAGRFPGACDDWSLTKAQAEAFFALGEEMDARDYHHEYDASRCMIAAELVSGGEIWKFKINGAAKGYWVNAGRTRYFGCDSPACEPLVLVPHIARPPEETAVDTGIQIINVAGPRYEGAADDALQGACQGWRLTPQQVEQFFQLSEQYESNPYSGFYQLPCSVSRKLQAEGKAWTFEINGGATATWRAEGETRHWGCSAKECGPLVLMPTDSMVPEGTGP